MADETGAAVNEAMHTAEERNIGVRANALQMAIDARGSVDTAELVATARAFAYFLDPANQKAPDAPK